MIMNEEMISRIRVQIDKTAVTYHWLQKTFNILPTEVESYMKQLINQDFGENIEYLKCDSDNIQSSVVISLKPSMDFVNATQYREQKITSDKDGSNFIVCNEAKRLLRNMPALDVPTTVVKKEVIKSETIVKKTENNAFVSNPVKKTESKPKINASKVVKGQNIMDSLKRLDSVIKKHSATSTVTKVELTDTKTEPIIAKSIESVEQVAMKVEFSDDDDMFLDFDNAEKGTNLFDNFVKDSNDIPEEPKTKRRRLVILSDDEEEEIEDKVLVNDSMMEEKEEAASVASSTDSVSMQLESIRVNKDKKKSVDVKKRNSKKVTKEEVPKKDTKKSQKQNQEEVLKKERKSSSKKVAKDNTKKEMEIDLSKAEIDSNKRTKAPAMEKIIDKSKSHHVLEDSRNNTEEVLGDGKEEPSSRKRKITRLVERTFKDEDGFLVTQKVMETFSDNENDENVAKKPSPVQVKAPGKRTKKVVDIEADLKKNKQMSLMSFFQKKN